MLALEEMPHDIRAGIRGVFVDIDDTLTTRGRLTARAYAALEALKQSGKLVIPVTGRPAGWCDHIARMWPVSAVVGENGAFYFHYDEVEHTMCRRWQDSDAERADKRRRLSALAERIVRDVPGAGVAADQHYRETDLAIDFCEDVRRLCPEDIERIVALFETAGATAKVSSIHVNGWFGSYDKLSMTRTLMQEVFDIALDSQRERFVFVGDSPNDAPMFAYFPHAVGVANVCEYSLPADAEPRYRTQHACGDGFAEVAEHLLEPGCSPGPD